jgi:membrane protein implicated in regulation of membrane protease activity
VANVAELSVVATIAYAVWHHPYITLAVALVVLVLLALLVRTIWRAARRALRGFREPPVTETPTGA